MKIDVAGAATMELSAAIMEDAGKAIDDTEKPTGSVNTLSTNEHATPDSRNEPNDGEQRTNNYSRRKRKGDFGDARMQHGSRRGGRNDNKRHKKGDMGRGEYLYVLSGARPLDPRH